ncbi:MAG TPA: O-linked N-acetylglucosamine transferase, SPINDLY family protein, partial [Allocoleopsis sp.]
DYVERYRHRSGNHTTATKPLKIGYLSSCLRLHSVGWLVRWLLAHHDRHQYEIHLYSTRQSHDPLQQAFINAYGENFHHLPNIATEIADQIDRDQIDILVELDSITAFDTCVVSALKPAPVQVTWLGCDASGIPAIDYYIADPYVLPENAQEYYRETIWRLPQTYIAVDGFEVGVPDLRRDQLNIPSDAIVYLSSQTGLKRNPDNVRLQLQILKQVPNSYFLIKSFNAEPELLKAFFYQLAEEEGVSGDRLRFLPDFPDNAVYRANLGLADVILDTYPYNGATTTLEALWVGLPIVTRVGDQFAARNSYTMMMNVGVTEGIAWSDQEYLEWGVRLGEEEALRRRISYQLRQSRQSAPLWNGQQFAREMEKAYQQMWNIYQNG